MKSIVQENKENCFICGKNAKSDYWGLDEHHCYGGKNRQLSEKYGLKVYICHNECHLNGVHKNADLDKALKAKVQKIAMEYYKWNTDDFIRIFGKNYL